MGKIIIMICIKTKLCIFTKFILLPVLLIGCSSSDNELIKIKEKTDLEIYKNALSLSVDGNHKEAAQEFDALNLNHPYSSLTSKAEIMTAYSLYKNNKNKKAIVKLQIFLEMNPADQLSDYAHYLLAMCYYTSMSNKGRDSGLIKKALNYFQIVISKYPESKYAKDAKLKIQYINNSLASNELLIGVFYLKKNFPAAAIKRFKKIIVNYKNSNVIPETLYRLCEALLMIGLLEEAEKSKALLIYNFPQSNWADLSKKLIKSEEDNSQETGLMISIQKFINEILD